MLTDGKVSQILLLLLYAYTRFIMNTKQRPDIVLIVRNAVKLEAEAGNFYIIV